MIDQSPGQLLRHSLDFVSWKDRTLVAAALKDIYRALDAEAAQAALGASEESLWGRKYPAIGQSWRCAWTEIVPFYTYPGEVRRIGAQFKTAPGCPGQRPFPQR